MCKNNSSMKIKIVNKLNNVNFNFVKKLNDQYYSFKASNSNYQYISTILKV